MTTLDRIAAELYGTLPEEFIAARDEHVRQARAAGDRELARELAKLRRPTQGAWLVNRLVRDEGPALEELFGMGEEYTAALAERDGSQLKELTRRRRDLEARLVARAAELGAAAGVLPGDETLGEVHGTLDAAVSDPETAEQVRSGRLVKAAGWSVGAPPPQRTGTPRKSVGKAAAGLDEGAGTADGAAHAARAEEAERAARDQAAAELAERTSEAERANAEYEQLSEHLEQLRAEAREVAQQVTSAQQAALRAERRRAQAERKLAKLGKPT